MRLLYEHYPRGFAEYGDGTFRYISAVRVCDICGWWIASIYEMSVAMRTYAGVYSWGDICAVLRKLDLTDISIPVKEVRNYLAVNYTDRYQVHPRKFEETVASVFRDLGYYITITGYIKDGGIDVVLQKGEEVIGVEVKRHKNKIGVDQIRQFAGALMINDLTEGVFVTTSQFTAGAKDAANQYVTKLSPIPIELIDAEKFLEALKVTQIPAYQSINDLDLTYMRHNLDGIDLHGAAEFDGLFDDSDLMSLPGLSESLPEILGPGGITKLKAFWRYWFGKDNSLVD